MSPVSMLEVFAHLAQGDIPLLSASHTHAHVAYMQTAALQSKITAYITKMARSFGNSHFKAGRFSVQAPVLFVK